ncbi:MAG: imidazoleglycerol-phosphate dehydratase HisB [Lachnospiraceae bacterium]|nr:imidazoleglycerol-phosphate dehydratase HisB [Lachnospiraceae bacterium]
MATAKATSKKKPATVSNKARIATVNRKTKETDISVTINLDGTGQAQIDTGIGFFDHMLEGFAKHGLFDLKVKVNGDLHVDGHHSVEDCGIVLGQAICEALGEKEGISRFGYFILPMDDALVLTSIDLGGRFYIDYNCTMYSSKVGEFETQLAREFFYALASNAKMNLHIRQLAGFNDHHTIEAMFKSFAKSLDMATKRDSRISGVLSTKGTI